MRIFIEAPIIGDSDEQTKENMRVAMECADWVKRENKGAIVVNLLSYLPRFTRSSNVLENTIMEKKMRYAALTTCDTMYVFSRSGVLSREMKEDLEACRDRKTAITTIVVDKPLRQQVASILYAGVVAADHPYTIKEMEYDYDDAECERDTFNNPLRELSADIIDVFEEFMDARGISWPNAERDTYEEDSGEPTNAILFGDEFDDLLFETRELIENVVYYSDNARKPTA